MRRTIFLAALSFLLPVATGLPAAAADAPLCGEPVTESVTLTGDLPCGLRIEASDVTVDLNGYTLGGSITTPDHADGLLPLRNIVIRNGAIREGSGIHFGFGQWTGGQTEAVIEDIVLSGDGGPGRGEGSSITGGEAVVLTVRNVHIDESGSGIDIFRGRLRTLEGSTFTGNDIGVNLVDTSVGAMRGNRFTANDTGLRWLEQEPGNLGRAADISNNQFRGNGTGLTFAPTDTGWETRFVKNHFVGNEGDGMHISAGRSAVSEGERPPADGSTISRNIFDRNGGDGLRLTAFGPDYAGGVSISDNRAFHNGLLGINAPDASDGGGNHGRRNGDPAECVGVVCQPGR